MTSSEFFNKFKSKYLWGNLFAMGVVVALLCVGVKFGIELYTHHGEAILIPDIRYKSFADAERILDDAGLQIEVTDTGYVRNLPPDCILEQSPVSGERVKAGRVIYVTINSDHTPTLTIPDVIDNSSLREAMAKLTAMGFKLGAPQYIPGEEDWVYGILVKGRHVVAGDKVSIDAILTVQVGNGQRDAADSVNYIDPKYEQEMYLKQRPEELEKLVEIAKVQSTEASNAIEGIVTTSTRIRQLVEEKTTPKNRDEQEIAGYRDVLNIIHESFDAIPITQNYILQLHKILYSHMNNPMAGRTKSVQNYISATCPDGHVETLFTPLAPYETPKALDRICEEYNRVIGNMEVEPLIAIPVFIHDFLCIHPFNDGNGRMSRLLTTLLLYRNGFYVGKYISLEAKIAKNKDLYYDALSQAQTGWNDGTEDVIPFIKYLLGTVLAAYKDFEDRFALVETKLPALDTVRLATMNKLGRFTKQDIRELCPALSVSSIEGALRKLVASGEIKREGLGKNICYYRLK